MADLEVRLIDRVQNRLGESTMALTGSGAFSESSGKLKPYPLINSKNFASRPILRITSRWRPGKFPACSSSRFFRLGFIVELIDRKAAIEGQQQQATQSVKGSDYVNQNLKSP
jgi:hypothetical protein